MVYGLGLIGFIGFRVQGSCSIFGTVVTRLMKLGCSVGNSEGRPSAP